MRTCPVFDEEAVVWCANLLGIEVMRLKEILQDVSSHYREFWIRKRSHESSAHIYFLLISFLYVSGAFLGRECQYTS